MRQVMLNEPPALDQLGAPLPRDLVNVVTKAMENEQNSGSGLPK